ncbi:recombination regulator RecX [Legionella impletisoli]|uniref:Regulatory protein RecX n=1 Tax=Legionella impletisoli TaxID=343510 RepID=A0A917N9D9_9GAMM|nr:recombination regulator RecX [Legionella impletisoli]GGI79445.1 recombination regulator RecX [Legionella impletisoli]
MSQAYACAVRLLARREHGAHELFQKLAQKGFTSIEADAAVAECQRLGFQCDERFAESVCRNRVRQGYGPLRIEQELKQLRIDGDVIQQILSQEQHSWLFHAKAAREKRFQDGENLTGDAIQKQKRFLLYRGFPSDVIHQLFKQSF